jgi:hypothetical protein
VSEDEEKRYQEKKFLNLNDPNTRNHKKPKGITISPTENILISKVGPYLNTKLEKEIDKLYQKSSPKSGVKQPTSALSQKE